jgi:hypothetical protein
VERFKSPSATEAGILGQRSSFSNIRNQIDGKDADGGNQQKLEANSINSKSDDETITTPEMAISTSPPRQKYTQNEDKKDECYALHENKQVSNRKGRLDRKKTCSPDKVNSQVSENVTRINWYDNNSHVRKSLG